ELIAINYGERIAINTARRPSLQECEGALRAAVKFAADSPILADTLVPTCCPTKASVPFQSLCAQVSLAELDSALACIAGARKGHGDDPCAVSECMNQDRRIPHYKSIPTSLDKSVAVKVAQYIDGCAHDAPVAYLKTVIADPVAARKDLCRNPVANAVDAMSPAAREQERELIARAEEICDAPYDAPNVP
ncbi:MAG TPA: hypothetical protein VJ891_05175, partial [Casimicrobiaceae bacterium]|nr:hypothetical protein [Casimicrobiaceae bacterium]